MEVELAHHLSPMCPSSLEQEAGLDAVPPSSQSLPGEMINPGARRALPRRLAVPRRGGQPEWGFPHPIKVLDKVVLGKVLTSFSLQSLGRGCSELSGRVVRLLSWIVISLNSG